MENSLNQDRPRRREYSQQFKAEVLAMIRIDAAWLVTAPLDMRVGADTALARVVAVFGAAHPHHAYLFANKRALRTYQSKVG